MSWLKRTLKKAGNTIGDTSKWVVNRTVGTPYTIATGKSLIGAQRYKNKKFGNIERKTANATKKVGRVALAAAGAFAGGRAISKAAKAGKFASKSGSLVSRGLGGLKKVGSTIAKGLTRKKQPSPSLPKNIGPYQQGPRTLFVPKKTGMSTTANLLNGSAEGENILSSFVPKDSKIGKMLGKLPSIGEIFGGASDGAIDVIKESEAGREVEKKAITDWLKDNLQKIIISGLSLLVLILAYLSQRKNKKSYKY